MRPAGTAAMSIYRHVLYVLSYLSPSSDLSWDFLPFPSLHFGLSAWHHSSFHLSILSIGAVFERYALVLFLIYSKCTL